MRSGSFNEDSKKGPRLAKTEVENKSLGNSNRETRLLNDAAGDAGNPAANSASQAPGQQAEESKA